MASRIYTAQTLDRGLRVMETLARAERELTIAEIAAELDIHRTIGYRLLGTLEQRALVMRSPTGGYRLGIGIVRLAGTVAAGLRAIARPFLRALNEETDETVHLAILSRADVVFLEGYESSKTLRVAAHIGQSHPAHAGSMGKAILATMCEKSVLQVLPEEQLNKLTPRTIAARADLITQLQEIRQCGYALNVEESEIGIGSVAVAIVDKRGTAQAALSVAAPIARFGPAAIQRLAKAVARTATQIGRQL